MADTESKITSLGKSLAGGDVKAMGQDAINQQVAKNSLFPSLSFKQRIIGFSICAILGVAFGILSFFVILSITTSPARFAVPYSLSTLCLIASTFFLVGPWRQVKTMFHKTRWLTSLILILSFVMVLISAFVIKNAWLVLAFVLVEIGAFTWYALSYIPYARTVIIKFIKHGCRKT
ncbi:unnamed protein product [Moneuplotes crassus]|uniref:Vesicle transport protein n=1 Tax=Euplotes crassus TaxID=5936 RepID=A0AAD1Y0S0_EUPCR|nr:unnamed protein product [Moneuplotes crassus]